MPAGVRQPPLPDAVNIPAFRSSHDSLNSGRGTGDGVKFLAAVAVALTLGFALLIGAIRARAYDSDSLRRFFHAEGCPMPCWHGIQPGITPVDDAVRRLEAIPWVRSPLDIVSASGSLYGDTGYVRWRWDDSYPLPPDALVPPLGMLIVEDSVVQQIYLTTYLQVGDVWLALGRPQGGTVDFVKESDAPMLVLNNAAYLDGALLVMSYTGCPMRRSDVWRSPTFLWLRHDRADLRFDPYPAYYSRMIQWLRNGNREYC